MSWQISVPHRDRDESLIDVASHCRKLESDDAAVMRQVVLSAMIDRGLKTAGDLLDCLDGLTQQARRVLLDEARKTCGLEPCAVVDARLPRRHPLVLPPAPATPTTRLVATGYGTFREEPINPPRYAVGPSGAIVDLNVAEADEARQRARDESERAKRAAVDAERAVEGAEFEASRRARDAAMDATLPVHLRPKAAA